MALVAVICPSCGGTVQMEEEMSSGFCVHCGGKIVNDRNTGGQVPAEGEPDIVRYLKMTKNSLMKHDWEAARGIVENIVRDNPGCRDALFMNALLHYREKTFDGMVAKAESAGTENYGVFSKEDISKCWGRCTLSFIHEVNKRNMTSAKALVTVDGRESVLIEKGKSAIFGVEPGKHEISACFALRAGNTAADNLTFIADKDHEFAVKSVSAPGIILSFTPKLVQLR